MRVRGEQFKRRLQVVLDWWSEGGIILPIFDIIGGAIQHLFAFNKGTTVKADGFTYLKDVANKGTDRLQLEGVKNILDGVDGKIVIGNVGNTQYISTWVKQVVDNQILFSLANSTTTAVSVVAGVLTFGGSLTVNNIYIDGVSKTASQAGVILNDNLFHFIYIDYDQIATSNLVFGFDGTTYGNIELFDFRCGDVVEPIADVNLIYDNPNALFGTETGLWHLDEGAELTRFDSVSEANNPFIYESDFSVHVDSFITSDVSLVAAQSVGGIDDALKVTLTGGSGAHYTRRLNTLEIDQTHKLSIQFYIPSTNTKVDGISVRHGASNVIVNSGTVATNTWLTIPLTEFLATSAQLRIYAMDGATSTIDGDGDVFYIKEILLKNVKHGTVSGGVTWGTQDIVSFQNYYGYNKPASVYIPAKLDTIPPTVDVLGNALNYSGKAPKDGRAVESSQALLNGVDDEVNYGDCGSTTKFSLYVRNVVDNQYIGSLDNEATKAVYVSAGVLTFGAGLSASNITIDEVSKNASEAGALLNDNLIHLLEFDLVNVTCTDVRLGRSAANYGNIEVCKFELDELFGRLQETEGLVDYDRTTNGNDGAIVGTASAIWSTTQDLYHGNLLEKGHSLYEHATSDPILVPYGSNGQPLSITPPSGYTLTEHRPAGKWHNGAETKWMPNPSNDPELVYRVGISDTDTRHNSDTFVRPEFINKNNLAKTTDYVGYDKNITTDQGNEVDSKLGN